MVKQSGAGGVQGGVKSGGEDATPTKHKGRRGEPTDFGDAYNGRTEFGCEEVSICGIL